MSDKITNLFHDTLINLLNEKLEKASTQEEADETVKKFEEMDFSNTLPNIFSAVACELTEYMKDTMHKEVTKFRVVEQGFLVRQEQKWQDAFIASDAMYVMVLEATESYIDYVDQLSELEREKHNYTFDVMQHIQGRALQQFLEIITLMKNGFADCAYARWRSMYELTIVSSFIIKYGEEVAKAFIQASDERNSYEWARVSGIFSSKKHKRYISFNDLQRACDIDSTIWKHQYDLANKALHASSIGTFARLSNIGTEDVIPAGRSDYGITTPAEHSAISLSQITTMFFTIYPSGDNIVAVQCIRNWVDVIREIYFKTHDAVFPNCEKLWDNNFQNKKQAIDN